MQNEQLKRYIWLLDIVYSQGPITKEEIDLAWAESVLHKEPQPIIPRESFNRYRQALYKIFNIRIACNRRPPVACLYHLANQRGSRFC